MGLEYIQEALEKSMAGVSGVKLVVTLRMLAAQNVVY